MKIVKSGQYATRAQGRRHRESHPEIHKPAPEPVFIPPDHRVDPREQLVDLFRSKPAAASNN
jgi:hypothetical protein